MNKIKERIVEYDSKTNTSQITYIEHVDIPMMLLGISLKDKGGIEYLNDMLTTSQMDMLKRIIEVIARDIEKDNLQFYSIDKDGNGVISKRYLAENLGEEESNFKHKLSRIISKVINK